MRHRRTRLALATALAICGAGAPPRGQELGSRPAPGVRYLRRAGRHADGAPVVSHAVLVDLCSAGVTLQATAPEARGRTVSAWARAVGATVAINGDYFDAGSRLPLGPARGDGRWWPRGRSEHHDALLAVGQAGGGASVVVIDAVAEANDALWPDAATHGPAEHDVVAVRERVLVGGRVRHSPRVRHQGERHPRTAVGLTANGRTLILLVVDGRSPTSVGASVDELAAMLRALGASEGMKLDGGGSSTLYIAGAGVVNRPSDGRERVVANHLAVRVTPGVARSWCRDGTVPARVASAASPER